jgi:ABC-type lipoprotein export system ATPase subunit
MTLFQSLNSQGRTVVVVTHSREIAGLCPRRVTLVDGRVVDFVEKGGGN